MPVHAKVGITDEQLIRTVEAVRRTARGDLLEPPHRGHGQAYDDIIARMHDIDPSLSENTTTKPADVFPIIEELGWLSRARRVALGRVLSDLLSAVRDGGEHFLGHFRRPRGVVFVYLACSLARSERASLLRALVLRAQAKYDCDAAVGVGTEPLGGGRSYDAFLHRGRLDHETLERLRTTQDPFGDDSDQLTI